MTDLLAKNAQTSLVIVDTGCANITSVYCAIERLGCRVSISSDAAVIQSADKVIIPGVGTASQAMTNISAKNLVEVLQNLKQPTLGICLGMQLMTDYSAEGNVACLGLIPGQVLPLEAKGLRLPHMGWNTLAKTVDHPLLHGLTAADYVYGSQFAAIIGKGNYLGMQFHPERSSSVGCKLLQNFITLSAADLAG
jgi:glutamine amidotransferase